MPLRDAILADAESNPKYWSNEATVAHAAVTTVPAAVSAEVDAMSARVQLRTRGSKWMKIRARILQRDPICVLCADQDVVRASMQTPALSR